MQRRQEIKSEKEERRRQYEVALQDFHNSKPEMSYYACAKKHNVSKTTLISLVKSGETFKGRGNVLTVLSKEEENKLCNLIIQKLKLGYSLTFFELRHLIQEALIRLCKANPARTSPWENENHFPNGNFVYNFAARNNLVLRSTMELSKARSMLSLEGLMKWYQDTFKALVSHPDYADCWKDPKRILNQDETGLQVGASKVKVLAPRGVDHVLYSKGGGSHEHVSMSVTANAAGECVGTRLIYKGKYLHLYYVNNLDLQYVGKKNMAATNKDLKKLPTDGLTGKWKFSVSEGGFMTAKTYLDVMADIDQYLTENDIPRPVVVIIDGYPGKLEYENNDKIYIID